MNQQDFQFQDFPHVKDALPPENLDSDPETTTESRLLLNGDEPEDEKSSKSFWSMGAYQRLFDVDTHEVLDRLKGAVIPSRKSFLKSYIGPKPDLYGPLWICMTLVFTIAISGNIANYLHAGLANKHYHWRYDFHTVTLSATTIFSYAILVPFALWGTVKWMGSNEERLTLLELICVYGYSLTIFIPISILWVIQYFWLQWFFALGGASLSGAVLVCAIWPAVSQTGERRYVVLLAVILLHLLLSAGFMLYFFIP